MFLLAIHKFFAVRHIHYPVNLSSDNFHTGALVPSSDHCRPATVLLPPSEHYCIETVAPSGDHYSIYIRSIAKIRKCLTTAACKTIVHALVMSRVDYGNALLFGLPEMQLHKLQMIQNSAARLVTGTHRRDHITPVLFKLHWLPVRYRIEFKLLVLVYQAVHHLGPAYLTSLVTPYAPTRSLRSAAHRSLTIPRYNLERYGRRAFSVAGPSLWNNLPVTIREAGTLTTFKSTLKTHLFRIAFKALC